MVFKVENIETGEAFAAKIIHVYNDQEFEKAMIEVDILR